MKLCFLFSLLWLVVVLYLNFVTAEYKPSNNLYFHRLPLYKRILEKREIVDTDKGPHPYYQENSLIFLDTTEKLMICKLTDPFSALDISIELIMK